jgi:hypothetical protein
MVEREGERFVLFEAEGVPSLGYRSYPLSPWRKRRIEKRERFR